MSFPRSGLHKPTHMSKTYEDVAVASSLHLRDHADIHTAGAVHQDSLMALDGAGLLTRQSGAGSGGGCRGKRGRAGGGANDGVITCGHCGAAGGQCTIYCPEEKAADTRDHTQEGLHQVNRKRKCTMCDEAGRETEHRLPAAQDYAQGQAERKGQIQGPGR